MKKRIFPNIMLMIVSTITLFLTLSSCLKDEVLVDEEEQGMLVMTLGGVTTRAAGDPLFEDDELISKVRFLVFVNEVLEVNRQFTDGETSFNNPFILDVMVGTKDIYVVANETAQLTTRLEGINSKEELFALMADVISGPLSLPLLMTGYSEDVTVDAAAPGVNNDVTITMQRAAVKLSMEFRKGNPDDEVEITSVNLLSNARKMTLFPEPLAGTTITSPTYWNYNRQLASPLMLTTVLQTLDEPSTIYLYENITGSSHSNATQLEVNARYNGVNTTYRVYINEQVNGSTTPGDPLSSVTSPSHHLYSLRRGYHYRLNGTINGIGEFEGLTLSSYVLPWDLTESTVLFERVYSIDPHPTTAAHTYMLVNSNDEVSFAFKLFNPLGSTWTAQLSNPIDFEFSDADGAVSSGITRTDYTITIKPRNAQGTGERNTEFYITVGGVEIPLLQGSNLVGTGNRIIITQPAVAEP